MAIARVIVDDYSGEGPIAFPELLESLRQRVFPDDLDADLAIAREVLLEYLTAGRVRVHLGPALGSDLPVVDDRTARQLVEDRAKYVYGDGDEVRAWFSLDP